MSLPCIHYWFSPVRKLRHVRFEVVVRNVTGLEGLELLASAEQHEGGEAVKLYVWDAPERLREKHRISVTVPLAPADERGWNYFWPHLRLIGKTDAVVVNGYGNRPLFSSGKLESITPPGMIEPGELCCPTCHRMFTWDEARFGWSADECVGAGLLDTEVAHWRHLKKKRRRYVGVDAEGKIFHRVFCPSEHCLPEWEGVADRLSVGVLGEKSLVRHYGAQCSRRFMSHHAPRAFRGPGLNSRSHGALDMTEGALLTLHPRKNDFPISLWLFGLWEEHGQRAGAWSMAPHLNAAILLVSSRQLQMGRPAANAGPNQSVGSPADLLGRFIESTDGQPGSKLPMSLAIVVTDCDALIRDGVLPRNIAWNVSVEANGHYNPLIQCDTSARLGQYVAREMPSLASSAEGWFTEVAYFGIGSARQQAADIYRLSDAVMWMLARRKQIPVISDSEAFKNLNKCRSARFAY